MKEIRQFVIDEYELLLEVKGHVSKHLAETEKEESKAYYTGLLQAYREEQGFLENLLEMIGKEEK